MPHNIRIELAISFSSRWHVGSGEGSFACDRLIRRDVQNRPYIPGSTLKGIIRQSCEKLSRTLGFPAPSDPHQADLTECQGFMPYDRIASPVDRLFGTRFVGGELFFRDARPGETNNPETFTRSRTALYRALKTAKEKHLFFTEYSEPSIFHTIVEGWHKDLVAFDDDYPPFAYCLLVAGILAIERIGADKTTGAGWLAAPLTLKRAEYNGVPIDIDDVFEFLNPQDYLDTREES